MPCVGLGGKWDKAQSQAFVLKLSAGAAAAGTADVFVRCASAFGKRQAGIAGGAADACESSEISAAPIEVVIGSSSYAVVDGSLELPEAMAVASVVGVRNTETQQITLFVREIAIGTPLRLL